MEADETYIGRKPDERPPKFKTSGRPFQSDVWSKAKRNKRAVIALVERGGEVRSFHVSAADMNEVVGIVRKNIARESRLHTDKSKLFTGIWQSMISGTTTALRLAITMPSAPLQRSGV